MHSTKGFTYLLTYWLDLLMLFGCPGDVGGSSVGDLRRSSRCSVDWEHEHRPWRQQDALSGQQRTNQVHAVHSHAVRSPRSCRRVAGHRQPVRRHSLWSADLSRQLRNYLFQLLSVWSSGPATGAFVTLQRSYFLNYWLNYLLFSRCISQGFIQPFVSGGVWNYQGGVIEWPKPRREAPSGGGVWEGGVPSPGMGVRGCHPWENFGIWDAIWCNLMHFGKKLTVLQFSTFVNENIAIMLDSGLLF